VLRNFLFGRLVEVTEEQRFCTFLSVNENRLKWSLCTP